MRKYLLLATLLTLPLLSVGLLGQGSTSNALADEPDIPEVYGFVKDGRTGYGIPNVKVTLSFYTSAPECEVFTDARGRYSKIVELSGNGVTATVCSKSSSVFNVTTLTRIRDILVFTPYCWGDPGYVPGEYNPPDRNFPEPY